MKFIILLGKEKLQADHQKTEDAIREAIDEAIKEKISNGETVNREDFQVFGNGKKTTKELLQDPAIQTALKNANDETLVIVQAHGEL
jgi:hypothetical protein